MQGRLIVFEGVEGCGKTTQIERSRNWFQESGILQKLQSKGYISQIIITREPGGTELCQVIRQLLLQPTTEETMQSRTELLLYAADRAQHVEGLLQPLLREGALILCDRYTDSTVAYQGYGRGLNLTLIDQLNQIATAGLTSDLTIWLDVDVEIGLARAKRRGKSDRMEKNSLEFHQRVQEGFRVLAQTSPERVERVNATVIESEVTHQIQAILQERLINWYPGVDFKF